MPLSSGTRVGPYEITAPLGAGGMGEVYRARDSKLGRDVALKVLSPALAGDADYMARFTREAQVLASLNHPNVAAIYGLEESNGVRALVMELVEGPTLAERIAASPLPLQETLHIAKQVADALEAAHDKVIVHRDLKPANVKITPEGVVKVLDFGLAKAPEQSAPISASSPTLTLGATQAGVIMGTAAYMSPEQAAAKPVDKRADIWSFGVVLWEMLTGRELFCGETISHTLADVLRAEIDVRKLPAGTPQAIRELVRRCLDRDTKTRLRDIGEARIAIQEYLANPVEELAATTRRSRLPWAVTGVLSVALGALGFAYYRRAPEEPRALKFVVSPPDKATFDSISAPAVSPDGRSVAFVAKRQLWVRDLNSLAARPLPGTEAAVYPFWSPDSRFLAFFASGKLKKIDVSGGPAQILCDAGSFRGGSWSQNGVILFNAGVLSPLYRVPEAGGAATALTALDKAVGENSHRWPRFLSDGRHFLYTATNSDLEKSAIYIADLESKDRRRLLAAGSNSDYTPGYLLFMRERTLIGQPFDLGSAQTTGDPFTIAEQVDFSVIHSLGLFSVSPNGVLAYYSGGSEGNSQLSWFGRDGKPIGQVGAPGLVSGFAISPDGGTVAAERRDPRLGTYDIWLHDLARGADSRFTFDPKSDFFPVWSPDGNRVAFGSNRDGLVNLYQKAVSGAEKEEALLQSPRNKRPTDWSRDGRFLIYDEADSKTKRGIWVLPLSGESSPVPGKPFSFLHTEFNEHSAKLSPDGHWLVYVSDETGRNEVYAQTFPTPGGKYQVSTSGGNHPVWSRDGKELFYIADRRLMAVEVTPGTRFGVGTAKLLFDVGSGGIITTGSGLFFDVSPDGRRFLLTKPLEEASDPLMTVVVNWQAGLKK